MLKISSGRIKVLSLLLGVNALLALSYIAVIAVVMSYAALHVEFAQEVRSDEAAVAALESSYLASLSTMTGMDYRALGYTRPLAKVFVTGSAPTALNNR
jgi:purine-cytosine permease-like protein